MGHLLRERTTESANINANSSPMRKKGRTHTQRWGLHFDSLKVDAI